MITIVGKRILIWWPSFRKYYSGIIIGYEANLKNNLIFYDVRNQGVNIECDFMKAKLYPDSPKARVEKWRIIPDSFLARQNL